MIISQNSGNLEFILNEKISDHKPIEAGHFLVWNILCIGRVVNNGFRMDETSHNATAYCERLKKIASYINHWIFLKPDTEFICLQEAPYITKYLDLFLDALDWSSSLKSFDRSS